MKRIASHNLVNTRFFVWSVCLFFVVSVFIVSCSSSGTIEESIGALKQVQRLALLEEDSEHFYQAMADANAKVEKADKILPKDSSLREHLVQAISYYKSGYYTIKEVKKLSKDSLMIEEAKLKVLRGDWQQAMEHAKSAEEEARNQGYIH